MISPDTRTYGESFAAACAAAAAGKPVVLEGA